MFVEKKHSPKQILRKIRGLIKPPNVMVKAISPSIQIQRDVGWAYTRGEIDLFSGLTTMLVLNAALWTAPGLMLTTINASDHCCFRAADG